MALLSQAEKNVRRAQDFVFARVQELNIKTPPISKFVTK